MLTPSDFCQEVSVSPETFPRSPSEETSGEASCLPSVGFTCFKTRNRAAQAYWGDLSRVAVTQDGTAGSPTERGRDQSTTFVNRGFGPLLHVGKIWALVVGCCRSRRNSVGWIQSFHAGERETDQAAVYKVISHCDSWYPAPFYLQRVKRKLCWGKLIMQTSVNPVSTGLVIWSNDVSDGAEVCVTWSVCSTTFEVLNYRRDMIHIEILSFF